MSEQLTLDLLTTPSRPDDAGGASRPLPAGPGGPDEATSAEAASGIIPLRRALADGQARSLDELVVDVGELSPGPVATALESRVDRGEVDHDGSPAARLPGWHVRVETWKPCREGQHIDHHEGVWSRRDGTDPVLCPCARCERA